MKTDYTSGMDEVKHQRELSIRRQISDHHLKDDALSDGDVVHPPVSAREVESKEVMPYRCNIV